MLILLAPKGQNVFRNNIKIVNDPGGVKPSSLFCTSGARKTPDSFLKTFGPSGTGIKPSGLA